jgi:uncharacterized protein (DUF1697 family)
MQTHIILIRGINVGGKNKLPMAELRACLEQLGFSNVDTYIASGNVILDSDKPAPEVRSIIESTLPKSFKLDSELIKVLVLSPAQLQAVIDFKPGGFGEQPDRYHSDAIFLIDVPVSEGMKVFRPREGVDQIWQGDGVIYSQRLSAERTKSRLGAIIGTPVYKSMTIRNWNTTTKLLELAQARDVHLSK